MFSFFVFPFSRLTGQNIQVNILCKIRHVVAPIMSEPTVLILNSGLVYMSDMLIVRQHMISVWVTYLKNKLRIVSLKRLGE